MRQRPRRRRRKKRERLVASLVGKRILIIIVCDVQGWWPSEVEVDDSSLIGKVAAVCLSNWVFEPESSVSSEFDNLASKERRRTRARDIFGFISYPIKEIALFSTGVAPVGRPSEQIESLCSQHASEYDWSIAEFAQDPQRLADIVQAWQTRHNF